MKNEGRERGKGENMFSLLLSVYVAVVQANTIVVIVVLREGNGVRERRGRR